MAYDDEAAPETSVGFSGVHGSSRRASSGRTVTRSSPAERTSGERSAVGAANGHVLTRPRPEAAAVSAQVAKAALGGLTAPRKTLPPSLFYDEEGCRLFYEITKLPEYYLTRSEFRLLERTAPEVTALLPTGATLVEYGASDETKAEMLLRQTSPAGQPDRESVFRCYIPIDVAAPALRAMRDRLADRRPGLTVLPVTADFMRPIVLPERRSESALMGFFPGSTIGNLEPGSAVAFLRRARLTLHPAGHSAGWRGSEVEHPVRFLLGFDTCRDPARLVPAYDDSAGVTARFNRNLLVRLNREAGGTFDPDDFIHRAVWNEAESRIEMHLVSRSARTVMLAGQSIDFARGETIHTENSYKYAPERMRAMVEAAGWSRQRAWTDPDGLFTLWLLAGSRCDPPRPEFPVGNIK